MTTVIIGNTIFIGGAGGVNGDNLSYGSAPLVGTAQAGYAALCEEASE